MAEPTVTVEQITKGLHKVFLNGCKDLRECAEHAARVIVAERRESERYGLERAIAAVGRMAAEAHGRDVYAVLRGMLDELRDD